NKNSTAALGVEFVGDEVRLALVEVDEQGIALQSTQSLRSSEELVRALRALPRRPASVTCAVSLEQAAVRVLSLPPSTEENLERVVTLEAESALPLSSEDLALSHHVLGMTEQSRLEVLLAAARQRVVQEALSRVNCLPWVSASVTVTPVALFNAVQQLHPPGRDSVAVLRIEEGDSELMILDRSHILATRLLPIGCGAAAPAPQLVPAGVGGREEAPAAALSTEEHPWITPLSQQVRYALQALSYERGLRIERLYVCGKGASRAAVDWHLGEQLGIPVAPLAPAGTGADGAVSAVAYGCALQGAGKAAISLNMTPARVAVAREIEQRRQTRFSWGALVGSVVLAAALVFAAAVYNRQQALTMMNARLQELGGLAKQPAVPPGKLTAALTAIDEASETRVPAARTLMTLSRQLPEGTWLAELAYNSETGSVVRGYSTDPTGAQRAQIALLRQRLFDEVTLDYLAEEKIGSVPVWGFQLSCRLKPRETSTRKGGRR
ncbi:MAG TPA: pilus assembly protein PilM, partial [Armatimonadota bacterium]|nr:pilus assembly protein PilM [Armatimonadota bacterium]